MLLQCSLPASLLVPLLYGNRALERGGKWLAHLRRCKLLATTGLQ